MSSRISLWYRTRQRQGAVFDEIARASHTYCMQTFWQWLAQLRLDETYYGFDPTQYNALFDSELEKIIARTSDAKHRQALERMQGFGWMAYIAASVRHAGVRDYRDGQERIHDIAVKLLVGTLFRGFDERVSGPMDLRFRASVGNAIRNMVEKDRNRRRLLPTVPIQPEFEPGRWSKGEEDDERVIHDFRQLVRRRLGGLGIAVLDARFAGEETKSLADSPLAGNPGKNRVKQVVQQIKSLAREYATSLGDPAFLRDIERAMGREDETIQKRRTAMAARQGVGA